MIYNPIMKGIRDTSIMISDGKPEINYGGCTWLKRALAGGFLFESFKNYHLTFSFSATSS